MGWERELKVRFNDRVRFDEIERKLYSHDMSSMPEMVTSLFKTTPAAVVQPVNEQELLYLTAFARNYHLPLVPRGAGSSGYGGCVPSRGGIVVEMHRMNQIRSVNSDQMTATVEPGVIWSELEEKLNRQGLGVRTYPSSAPGATVGGWIAEGGGGIGGYAYGYLGSPGNIVALRVITPEGKIENMDETQALNLVYGAEGITGFITEATIKLRPYKGESVILARFPGVNNLVTALQEAEKQSLPLWNVSFSTARFLRLAGKAKGREEDTDSPSALFVFVKDDQETENKMYAIISACGGQISPPATAEEHWRERFFPMRIKQLGPSLIPSEAIVPLKRLDVFLNRQQQELPDLAVEGTLIRGEEGMETTLLGFLTGDERTFSYSLTYTKSLKMIDIAKATGGRVYALGLYFTDEAAQKLGHRLAELQSYKQAQDPESLFNPDKILPNNKKTLQFAMRAGKLFSPLAQGITKALPKQAGDNNKRIPPRLTRDAFACAQCGYCRNVCTLFKGKEWESASPRGKFYFLREYIKGNLPLTQEMTDKFLLCTTCKRCDDVCQVNIPIEERWQELRPILTEEKKMATFPGFEMMHSAFDHAHNIWAGRYSERAAWFPEDLEFQPEGEIGYWAGCTASYVEQDIARNAVRILAEGGEKFTYLAENEACCGIPFLMAGKPDVFASAVRNNITEANKRGIKKMIISCPGCWITRKRYYPEWAKKNGSSL